MPVARSPSYPNISLSEAISKAQQIYRKEHMSAMVPAVVAEAMGYGGVNGASLKTIGALKKYGLLEGRGDGVRLTKDAQILAIDDPSTPDYRAALARAATAPEVFSDISKQFQSGGSERNIAVFLEKQGYMPDAASTIAKHYKDSMALVATRGGVDEGADGSQDFSMSPSETAVAQPAARSMIASSSSSSMNINEPERVRAVGDVNAPFRITMNGTKLHIEADVDLAGLQTLKQMLDGYEKILALLATPVDSIRRPEWADRSYKPGDAVPVNGTYALHHPNHSGEDSAMGFSIGRTFPSCNICGGEVRFKVLQET